MPYIEDIQVQGIHIGLKVVHILTNNTGIIASYASKAHNNDNNGLIVLWEGTDLTTGCSAKLLKWWGSFPSPEIDFSNDVLIYI